VTTREELHARIEKLSDREVEQLAAVLDTLSPPLPLGRGTTGADMADVWRAYQARLGQVHAAQGQQGTWGGLLAYLAEHENALTPEFARDLAEAHALVNTPASSDDPWER